MKTLPNHAPDGSDQVDNHDVLTGTDDKGDVFSSDWAYTCHDWTSKNGADGTPRVGHSWPRSGGPGGRPDGSSGGGMDLANWMSSLRLVHRTDPPAPRPARTMRAEAAEPVMLDAAC